ncbi:hypothetical protein OH76DRAFT_157397 [Lentinus brumalis]|uniref:Uncharacterized protein n=1 Tax=Lentinus brumalis TaxID=2498619 RepID=A0A371DIT3_9APHY|nr:hypothetical protein OH76DRAFT_157397 [Polyporus brumalis]
MAIAESGFPFTNKSLVPKTPYPGAVEASVVRSLPPLSTQFPLHLHKTLSAESSPSTDEGYSTESSPSCAASPPGIPETTNVGIEAYGASMAETTTKRTAEFFEDLGPLETAITFDQLPDELVVYEHGSTVPVQYKRVYARITEDGDRFCVPTQGICHPVRHSAILHLAPPTTDIHSSHSTIKRGAFTFADKCDRVVAKFPQARCGAHHRLHNEALAYEAFPPYIAEYFVFVPEDSDEPQVPQGTVPKKRGRFKRILRKVAKVVKDVATSSTNMAPIPDGESDSMTPNYIIIPPVVPKFFGYYVPAHVEKLPCHPTCGAAGVCATAWAQPVLLMEDCGDAIDVEMMSEKDKRLCALPLKFLHDVAFVHQGIAPSKFVMQPGPLNCSPEMRSWASPSFRVVGFGVGSGMASTEDEDLWAEFELLCEEDEKAANAVLRNLPTA